MTISTPQPDYIDDTQQVVEEALDPAPTEEHIKLVPTTGDWLGAKTDAFMIVCPLCASAIYQDDVDKHTAWHQKLLDLFLMIVPS